MSGNFPNSTPTETTPLLHSNPSTYIQSILSPFTFRSKLNLPPTDPTTGAVDWLSLVVIYWITLIAEAARGLVLPSAWPYLKTFGGSRQTLGYLVAAFTFGRVFANIPLGFLSDKYSATSVLIGAALLQAIGHFCYAISPSIPFLLLSRTLVGFSSATVSVCRAHFTKAIVPSQRTHHFAWLSATQFIGFVVLPGCGGALANLPTFHLFGHRSLLVNEYTYPAYVLILCNLLTTFLVFHFYLDPPPADVVNNTTTTTSQESVISSESNQSLSPDFFALTTCLVINMAFRGVVAELETVTVPLMMELYDMRFDKASYYITLVGILGLGTYFLMKPISKYISDRKLVVVGMILGIIGCLPLGYPAISDQITLPFFVLMVIVMWSFAFPIGQTAVLSLFSKVLAGLPAGGFLGLFSSCGATGRMFFALFAVSMWTRFGHTVMFGAMCAYQLVALGLTLYMYPRLVPANESVFVIGRQNGEQEDDNVVGRS